MDLYVVVFFGKNPKLIQAWSQLQAIHLYIKENKADVSAIQGCQAYKIEVKAERDEENLFFNAIDSILIKGL